jgi:hypothetical protein
MSLLNRLKRFFREDETASSERASPTVEAAYREMAKAEPVKRALRNKLETSDYSPSDAILGRSVLRSELKKASKTP